ncbi:uncharacterized protein K452DRAFT_259655 [Aplosporella prunicola CBS 121167]|uniref:Proline dehydrogenase n=1 Tax=Aplosporella prunicola CBS 121167 TaxID=1176127 RepID=A0A6A6AWR3_9PEZI|nr:uncharacterized protein K452DRAFT_259655 [Aplosporella prunicola CBS 121167]KAF2136046.1 hypothetical protein K452DRAFT_259655 [Aplosporella prunicola CBS 121167]
MSLRPLAIRRCAFPHGLQRRSLQELSRVSPSRLSPVERRPLQPLPLVSLLRSLLVLSFAALPSRLLSFTVSTLQRHADKIDTSRLARYLVKRTFYAQYCLGESAAEVSSTIAELRHFGITGVVLAQAKEANTNAVKAEQHAVVTDSQLQEWLRLNLETVRIAEPGDCIAVKYSGAGQNSIKLMKSMSPDQNLEDYPELKPLRDAGSQICDAAKAKGVRVLIDAEQQAILNGIDSLAMELMTSFNNGSEVVVYKTYQMYLKSTPSKLLQDLEISRKQGYIAGVKLVRGAYMHFEVDRSTIHDTKQDTDAAYDAAVTHLLTGKSSLNSTNAAPQWVADVMLASHNTQSIMEALELWRQRPSRSDKSAKGARHLSVAQLLGMADELSMQLAGHNLSSSEDQVSVYKYGTWGDPKDCLLYMLRRAEENKDSLARSRQSQRAILQELKCRMVG